MPFVISRSPVRFRRVALEEQHLAERQPSLDLRLLHFATSRGVEAINGGLVPERKLLPTSAVYGYLSLG